MAKDTLRLCGEKIFSSSALTVRTFLRLCASTVKTTLDTFAASRQKFLHKKNNFMQLWLLKLGIEYFTYIRKV
jgi:hypothetical protein